MSHESTNKILGSQKEKEKEQEQVAKPQIRYKEFTVTPGMRGFKVKIGCAELYFGDTQTLLEAIRLYLQDPIKSVRHFTDKDIRELPPHGFTLVF